MKKILTLFLVFLFVGIVPICQVANAKELDPKIQILLKQLEIMTGDQNGDLRLNDYVTRAEFSKIAVRASVHKNSVATNLNISPYRDVTHKFWASPFIKVAMDNALITGYSDGTFRPEQAVLYEEALNVALKLLGYTDEDFGSSWPYGQIGIAKNIGLSDNISAVAGMPMTRYDISVLMDNMLRTSVKTTTNDYINTLGYTIFDDTIIVATSKQDSSVGNNKVLTSSGTFKINTYFDYSLVEKKGELFIKDNEVVLFFPDYQTVESFNIYSVLDDDMVVYKDGILSPLKLDDTTKIYVNSTGNTLKAIKPTLDIGYKLSVYRNENNDVDYVFVDNKKMEGPFTVKNSSWQNEYNLTTANSFMRDGVKVTSSEIAQNDIIYYSSALGIVWAYSKQATGIYESAYPNKDMPKSIVLSGVTYNIEGTTAYNTLSSNGPYSYGDTITVLLGKTGGVADVKQNNEKENVVGFLYDTGTKTFTDTTGTYSSYYISVVKSNGETVTYATKSNYENIKNKIVTVIFEDKFAKLTSQNTKSSISGKFDWSIYKLGKDTLSKDVEILETSTTDFSVTAKYSKVYPKRLDNVTLKADNILYNKKNAQGEITQLFILDTTGDLNSYAMVTQAPKKSGMGGSYTVDINGVSQMVNTSKTYSVSAWEPCKVIYDGNAITTLTPLKKASSNVVSLSQTKAVIGQDEWIPSDTINAYVRTSNYTYMMISLTDLIDNQKDYTISAYYDSPSNYGGRLRILTAIKN